MWDTSKFHESIIEHGGIRNPMKEEVTTWLHINAAKAASFFPALDILDCGTYYGTSAFAMADGVLRTKKQWSIGDDKVNRIPRRMVTSHVYSIDNYKRQREGIENYHANIQAAKDLGYDSLLTMVNMDDAKFLAEREDASLAMVWIDSDHNYRHVSSLLEIVIPKMADGGMVCGHDYWFPNRGVVQAVEEWREKNSELLLGFGLYDICWWTIVKGGRRP